MRTIQFLMMLWVVVALSACSTVGKDFVRPGRDALVLGQTTREDILQKFGPPQREQTARGMKKTRSDGQLVEFDPALRDARLMGITYTFLDNSRALWGGGLGSVKELQLGFVNGKLYWYRFVSTFEKDLVDLDESKLDQIKKQTTNSEEVRALYGDPTSAGIYPATDYPDQKFLRYDYLKVDRKTVFTKNLTVFTSLDGVVTDYEFKSDSRPLDQAPAANHTPAPTFIPKGK